VHNPYFFAGRERELRDLIDHPVGHDLDHARCVGVDPDVYHPDDGQLDELALFRCTTCPARLSCLALALRAEDAGARTGWYGGLSPDDRDGIASILLLVPSQPEPPDRAIEATRLRASGWTVNQIAAHLGRSHRTVQRYLRRAA
jgi:hypothetical protein